MNSVERWMMINFHQLEKVKKGKTKVDWRETRVEVKVCVCI